MKENIKVNASQETYIDAKVAKLIPVSCHFDNRTLLTKNGDLMQIIEVNGFEPNDTFFKEKSLRDLIRDFVYDKIPSPDFAIYFHVLNHERNIMQKSDFTSDFASKLDEEWSHHNHWDDQLSSTLFITIVVQGKRSNSYHPIEVLEGISLALFKKFYFASASNNLKRLTSVVDDCAQYLSRFGTKVLEIKEKDGVCISEPLSFLYSLIHLSEKDIPVGDYDASDQLADVQITNLFNQIELINSKNEAISAAVFTLKPIHDYDLKGCEEILNHDFHYIISESLLFVPKNIAQKEFEACKDFLEAGRDQELLSISGVNEILNADSGRSTDYCKRQITITLYEKNEAAFSKSIEKFLNTLQELGIVAIREDFNMPRCFWSQVPGNFQFLARGYYNTSKSAGLLSFIPNAEIGSYNGSKWGKSITIFRTLRGLPYYFNFHIKDNGNTLLVGPPGSGKSVLTRFLIAQSTKYKPRIIYIDIERNNLHFIEALGGKRVELSYGKESPIQIDYFNMDNFNNDREVFKNSLIGALLGTLMKSDYEEHINKIVEQLSVPRDRNEIIDILKQFADFTEDRGVRSNVDNFIDNLLANFCSRDDISLVQSSDILEINLSECIGKSHLFYHFIWLLLAKIIDTLDGRPTIISLNRCQDIFTEHVFVPSQIVSWLQKLSSNNAIAIFSVADGDQLHNSETLKQSLQYFATQIFLSDKFANKFFKKAFMLSDAEMNVVKSHNVKRGLFLLKQHDESVAAYSSLDGLSEELATILDARNSNISTKKKG